MFVGMQNPTTCTAGRAELAHQTAQRATTLPVAMSVEGDRALLSVTLGSSYADADAIGDGICRSLAERFAELDYAVIPVIEGYKISISVRI